MAKDKKCPPTETEIVLAKQAALLAAEGNKLNRALREEDIKVKKVELLVPVSILDQSISNFALSGADWLGDGPAGVGKGDGSDVDTDWPGT